MKTMKVFLLASLVVTTGFLVACSSEDSLTDANANEDRGVVKTEFTISFPQNVAGYTRQSTATVQGQTTPVFRGIQDMKLYAFKKAKTAIDGSEGTSDIPFVGGTVGKAGYSGSSANTISGSKTDGSYDALYDGSNSHLYQKVDIPVGAQTFLFYGQAMRQSSADNFTDGSLDAVTTGALSNFSFSPKSIVQADNAITNNGEYVADYLTKIANTEGWSTSDVLVLASLYEQFTAIHTGSWASVKGAVQQLYTTLSARTDELSQAIMTTITTAKIGESNDTYVTNVNTSTKALTFATLGNFPQDMGLPDGSAYVTFNKTTTPKKFEVTIQGDNAHLDIAAKTDFAYPAALYYQALSSIVTSTFSKADAYNDTKTWAQILSAYEGEGYGTSVLPSTRSIAMVDQIQYAVGRLDITIQASAFSIKDFDNNDVSATGTNFQLTGVLVGNQKPVDYAFHPISTGNTYTLYDREINGNIYLTAADPTVANHTLVLETPEFSASDAAKVKIALEFLNNSGKALIGKSNCIIYPGTKFYLIGEFDPAGTHAANPNNLKQVFKQDYTTTAKFTIKSFKDAYNLLPDLRSPELEIGLSVDLDWKPGITHEITIN